jgi:hypothetical protein
MIRTKNLNSTDKELLKNPSNEEGSWQLIGSSCDDSWGVGNLVVLDMAEITFIGRTAEFSSHIEDTITVRVNELQVPSIWEQERGVVKPFIKEQTYYLFDFVVIKTPSSK